MLLNKDDRNQLYTPSAEELFFRAEFLILLQSQINKTFPQSNISDYSGIVELIEDSVLPSLVYQYFTHKSSTSFIEFAEQFPLNQLKIYSSVRELVENYGQDQRVHRNLSLKLLGDFHPYSTTKYFSNNAVVYRSQYCPERQITALFNVFFQKEIDRLASYTSHSEDKSLIRRQFIEVNNKADTVSECQQFYYKVGKAIPILLLLRATDLNAENLLIESLNPKFFDLEVIFSGLINNRHQYTIKDTGLLKGDGNIDNSMLSAGRGIRTSLLKPILVGTDSKPRVIYRTQSKGQFYNTLSLRGKVTYAEDFLDKIIEGWKQTQKDILSQWDAIRDFIKVNRFNSRVILRPTRIYKMLQIKAAQPSFSCDEDFFYNELRDLDIVYKVDGSLEDLLRHESRILAAGMIPIFFSEIHSPEIYTPNSEIVGKMQKTQHTLWEEDLHDPVRFFEENLKILIDTLSRQES